MKITRWGSRAYHGEFSTEMTGLNVRFDAKTGDIWFLARTVPDFCTHARHDYRITIERTEVAEMIRSLPAAFQSSDKFPAPCGVVQGVCDQVRRGLFVRLIIALSWLWPYR